MDWLSKYEGGDNNIQFYELLKRMKTSDFKKYEPVIIDGRTKGYILVFRDQDRYVLRKKNSDIMRQYELHIFVDALGELSDGESLVYVSIHFCD